MVHCYTGHDMTAVRLPRELELRILSLKVALMAFDQLHEGPVDCTVVSQAYNRACAQNPIFAHTFDQISYDLDLNDEEITDDTWEWLCTRQLRGLTLKEQGLARLLKLPCAPAFQQLVCLSTVLHKRSQMSSLLDQLDSLQHLEVTFVGEGDFGEDVTRPLKSLKSHYSSDVWMGNCKVAGAKGQYHCDRKTIATEGSIVWEVDITAGLGGLVKPAALLNIACGGCNGDLSRYGGVKLLMPSGYNQFFSDLELPKAIQNAAQFNCYAAAVAAIYALAPPFELILQAKAAIILEDVSGPLRGSAYNFFPASPNSCSMWTALWEAASTLSGQQFSASFEVLESASGVAGIRATVIKSSPAIEWPLPAQQPQREEQEEQLESRRAAARGGLARLVKGLGKKVIGLGRCRQCRTSC